MADPKLEIREMMLMDGPVITIDGIPATPEEQELMAVAVACRRLKGIRSTVLLHDLGYGAYWIDGPHGCTELHPTPSPPGGRTGRRWGMSDKFTCESCGATYDKGWSDEEARAEQEALFGDEIEAGVEFGIVCDDCFRKMGKWSGFTVPTEDPTDG